MAPTDVDVHAGATWLGDTRAAVLKPMMKPVPFLATIIYRPHLDALLASKETSDNAAVLCSPLSPRSVISNNNNNNSNTHDEWSSHSHSHAAAMSRSASASALSATVVPRTMAVTSAASFRSEGIKQLHRVTVQLPAIAFEWEAEKFALFVDVVKTVLAAPVANWSAEEEESKNESTGWFVWLFCCGVWEDLCVYVRECMCVWMFLFVYMYVFMSLTSSHRMT